MDVSLKRCRKLHSSCTTPVLEAACKSTATPTRKSLCSCRRRTEERKLQMRKIIAKRLAESLFTAPHYNLTIEVTMDDAMKSRAIINNIPDTKVSFNDMVIKACAMALKDIQS
jgi:pyruvate dehydrogenase E2 component (dihydrolipoamide acetyltransferase)